MCVLKQQVFEVLFQTRVHQGAPFAGFLAVPQQEPQPTLHSLGTPSGGHERRPPQNGLSAARVGLLLWGFASPDGDSGRDQFSSREEHIKNICVHKAICPLAEKTDVRTGLPGDPKATKTQGSYILVLVLGPKNWGFRKPWIVGSFCLRSLLISYLQKASDYALLWPHEAFFDWRRRAVAEA